jgi:hypothetical protein
MRRSNLPGSALLVEELLLPQAPLALAQQALQVPLALARQLLLLPPRRLEAVLVPLTGDNAAGKCISPPHTPLVAYFLRSNGWTGPTTCVSPYTCTKLNDWYYQVFATLTSVYQLLIYILVPLSDYFACVV